MKRERDDERRDPQYVRDIVRAAGTIKRYLHGLHRDRFDQKEMLRDAVIRQLGIIGEAAANLSKLFKERHSKQPWKDIVGLRQILLHKYWKVDPNIVWSTAKKDVRTLAAYLQRMLKKSSSQLDVEIAAILRKKPSKK